MKWITKSNNHKVKGREYITFIIMLNPTKSPKTIKIPKWIRFPIYFVIIVGVLSALLYMQRVTKLEGEVSSNNSQILTQQLTNEEKTKRIEELEKKNEDLITSQDKKLKSLQDEAENLMHRLVELEEHKAAIDSKINSTEKTTDRQPSESIKKIEANSITQLPNSNNPIKSDDLSFDEQLDSIEETLMAANDLINIEVQAYNEIEEKVDEIIPYFEAFPSILPISNARITSHYGWRKNPFGYNSYEFHEGIDLKANTGTPVKATGKGTVTLAGYKSGYGWTVLIDHGYGFKTRYAHNSKLKVSEGDKVVRGDTIAYSGNTGRSTGPHVHYEVIENGQTHNPLDYIYEGE